MYQPWVHSPVVHGLIYAVSVIILTLISHILFHLYSIVFTVTVLIVKKEKQLLSAHWNIYLYFLSLWGSGCLIMRESRCRLTVFVFQITTAGTTVMRQAVVTPVPALSSNVTAAAASQITGLVMEIMTVGTTATRPTQTAPIRVSVSACWSRRVSQFTTDSNKSLHCSSSLNIRNKKWGFIRSPYKLENNYSILRFFYTFLNQYGKSWVT